MITIARDLVLQNGSEFSIIITTRKFDLIAKICNSSSPAKLPLLHSLSRASAVGSSADDD